LKGVNEDLNTEKKDRAERGEKGTLVGSSGGLPLDMTKEVYGNRNSPRPELSDSLPVTRDNKALDLDPARVYLRDQTQNRRQALGKQPESSIRAEAADDLSSKSSALSTLDSIKKSLMNVKYDYAYNNPEKPDPLRAETSAWNRPDLQDPMGMYQAIQSALAEHHDPSRVMFFFSTLNDLERGERQWRQNPKFREGQGRSLTQGESYLVYYPGIKKQLHSYLALRPEQRGTKEWRNRLRDLFVKYEELEDLAY
jgi:hypothetical protein